MYIGTPGYKYCRLYKPTSIGLPSLHSVGLAMIRDDFVEKSSYWKWRVDGFAGFEIRDSILRMWMGPTEALYYSNAEIADGEFDECPWTSGILEVRARLIGNHFGSAGWGFWNHSMRLDQSTPIWFIYLRAYGRYPLQGFFVQVENVFIPIKLFSGVTMLSILSKIFPTSVKIPRSRPAMQDLDLSSWHIYRVEWRDNVARFYIDNTEIAVLRVGKRCRARADVWIDNAVYIPSRGADKVYRHVTQENRARAYLDIDWIEIKPA